MMSGRSWALVWMGVVLSGCVAQPKPPAPGASVVPPLWHSQVNVLRSEPVLELWWRQFDDAQLDRLVQSAFEANSSIRAAQARLRQAQSLGRAQATVRWPSLDLSSSLERSRRSNESDRTQTQTDYNLGLEGAWTLDLFGRNDLIVASAEQNVALAKAQARAVVLATLKAVVTEYYRFRGLQKRLTMTQLNTELLQQSVTLIEARYRAGEASEFDVVRARGEYQLSFSRLPELTAELRVSLYRLAVLTRHVPGELDTLLNEPGDLPELVAGVHAGLPVDLLQRRPDLMVAQIAANQSLLAYDLSVAELYPTFDLRLGVGFEADSVGDLLSLPSRFWSLGAFLDWPLFALKTKKALADAAYAEAEARLLEYEGAVLVALAEVQSAFETYAASVDNQKRLATVVDSRQQAWHMARTLFDAGETNFLAALDAERELVAARENLVAARVAAVANLISLYAALGGGWTQHPVMGQDGETRLPLANAVNSDRRE